jgi:DNA-binding SARP family transcriptional activator/tetratricopeptide (TPR) repeat protein
MSLPDVPGAPLEIHVLGPLEVRVDGAPIRVDTRKALAILALLAVEGRPYARDELAALFWPDSDDESARGALRRTLSVLRTALGDRWLRVDRAVVALGTQGTWIDLAAMDGKADAPDLATVQDACALARGPFLAGFSLRDSPDFDDWRATRAVTIERRVVTALVRMADLAEAEGNRAAIVTATERLVELDPLDEPARCHLMLALARAGDRAGAIRQYRATVATLERELGVAPLAETTELYEAIRDERIEPLPAPAAVAPVAGSGTGLAAPRALASPRLPMVGREVELRSLTTAHRAVGADGRLAIVTGEAGIGKSRLAESLAAQVVAAGGNAIVARAFPSEGAIAYAPLVELLRTGLALPGAAGRLARLAPSQRAELERLVVLPDGLTRHPADGARTLVKARLLEALATGLVALAAGSRPGLLVVEDLHWADDASREALLYLARRLAGHPVLVLLAWRPEDLAAGGEAFADALESLPDALVLRLDRLRRPDVRALAAAAATAGLSGWDPDELATESEGLPLYVVEALAAGPAAPGAPPPRGVRALLRERLASVSGTASQVLAAGAVIGRSFDLATVRGASGRSEEETITALEELVRRAIVREVARGSEPAFDFGHARLRDAAYEEIGLARRRLLHRRIADVLRSAPGAREDHGRLAQIAVHELAAGRDDAAAAAFREAGLGARRVFANREALDHLSTALALGHPDTVGLQAAIGDLRTALGDYAGAISALEAAAALASDATLPEIELRLGRVHARRGDLVTAASHLDEALALLGPAHAASGADALLAAVLVERSVVALRSGDLGTAEGLATRALEVGTRTGDRRATGAAHRLLGLEARGRGDLDRARAELALSMADAAAGHDPDAGIAARNAAALVEAAAGDHERAIQLLEEALAECRRTGETHLEAAVENNLADQLHAVGRNEESMDHLKRAVALFAEVGSGPGDPEPEIWKLVSW